MGHARVVRAVTLNRARFHGQRGTNKGDFWLESVANHRIRHGQRDVCVTVFWREGLEALGSSHRWVECVSGRCEDLVRDPRGNTGALVHHVLQYRQMLGLFEILKGRGRLVRMAILMVVVMMKLVVVTIGATDMDPIREWGYRIAVAVVKLCCSGRVGGCVRLQVVFDLMRMAH